MILKPSPCSRLKPKYAGASHWGDPVHNTKAVSGKLKLISRPYISFFRAPAPLCDLSRGAPVENKCPC